MALRFGRLEMWCLGVGLVSRNWPEITIIFARYLLAGVLGVASGKVVEGWDAVVVVVVAVVVVVVRGLLFNTCSQFGFVVRRKTFTNQAFIDDDASRPPVAFGTCMCCNVSVAQCRATLTRRQAPTIGEHHYGIPDLHRTAQCGPPLRA